MNHRNGFTLLEMLVVVGIIAILAGLLLPAVHQLRESTRLLSCESNIRQLALAASNFEQLNQVFPPGQLTGISSDPIKFSLTGQPLLGHLGYLLPFLELDSLKNRFADLDWSLDAEGNPWFWHEHLRHATDRIIGPLRCPSDSHTLTTGLVVSVVVVHGTRYGFTYADLEDFGFEVGYEGWTSYLGSMGQIDDSRPAQPETGMFFSRSKVAVAEVVDGTSNTLFFGEIVGQLDPPGHPLNRCIRNSFLQNGVSIGPHSLNRFDRSGAAPVAHSSRHRGGDLVNFAFVDGHTRTLSAQIDRQVLYALSTRNGGEIAQLD